MRAFENKAQITIFVAFLVFIFALNLYFEFRHFSDFVSSGSQVLIAKVEQNYTKIKNEREYFVLKLKTDDFSFYTTTKEEINSNSVKIGIVTKNIKFRDFIKKSFYAPNFLLRAEQSAPKFRDLLKEKITSQHENIKLKELYATLFLATPISKELRANVTNWGIAHIISISGFHLSLIFAILFFCLRFPYEYFQNKYFPYRDRNFDISLFIFALAGVYLWILDFTPSFLRSYVMGIVGFFFAARGIGVFRIENLFICVALALAFSPSLMFSLGFYFSALGVFFIFVYIRHFGDEKILRSPLKLLIHSLCLEIFVFSAMNIPVYYFFPSASIFQLSVIPLGYVFSVFYPLSIALHIFGFGGIFDSAMLEFIEFANEQARIHIYFWEFALFNALLLPAIKFKSIAIFIAVCGIFIFIFGLS